MPMAGLADISVLTNASLTSTTGNTMTPNSQGNYDLSLRYSGTGVASVGLADKKVLVYSLPSELQGKVVGGANVQIDAQLLPIVPADIPGVDLLFATVETAVDVFAAAVAITGTNVSGLQNAIDDLKELKQLGSYQATLPATVSADGKTISVDFTDGLGNYVHQAYASLFDGLEDAVNGISSANPIVNTALNVLKQSTNPLFNLIDEIGNGSSTVLNSALNANLLGQTSGTLTTTVSDPNTPTATIRASVVNNAAISADVISFIDQDGEPVTLNFPNDGVDPLENYNVATPSLDNATEGDTSISGSVALEQPVPEGTTFEAVATLGDGSEVTGTVDGDGSFAINTGALSANEVVSVKIKATNGSSIKYGDSASTTVQASTTEENPLANYNVATPTVNPATAGDTSVSGSVVLEQPVPEGTTFKAVATLPDGSEVEGDIDENGNFIINTGELVADENLSVKIVATNGENTKDSSPVSVTVQASTTEENPLTNYNVATPTVNPVTAGDTSVSGSVVLEQPVPEGTTFKAVVTMPDGSEVEGTIDENGNFTVDTGELIAGENLSVKVVATNGENTKDSASISVTVAPATEENPLANYNVSAPTVNPVTAGDTSVSGSVSLEQPIPEGTTFKAVVTLPDGSEVEGNVDENGNFTVDTGELVAGDNLSVKVVATNGENMKDSVPVSVTVQASTTEENPLTNYNVATPTVNPVIAGDTSVSGSVSLEQPVPEGTTFKAVVTLPDGSEVEGNVDENGNFTVDTGELAAGENLSVKVVAMNGENTKDSASISVTVAPATEENPLANYNVSTPMVNPVVDGDTSVSGSVVLEQPIPEGTTFEAVVTLADGTEVTGMVDENGNFTVNTGELNENDILSVKVVAHNGDNQKSSDSITITVGARIPEENPLANYDVSTPMVNPAVDGDTSISGSVNLNQPIPEGTTFKAVVMLPDGSEVEGSVDENGNFTVDTGELRPGMFYLLR